MDSMRACASSQGGSIVCGPGAGQGTVTLTAAANRREICKYDLSGEHWTESEFYQVTVKAACHHLVCHIGGVRSLSLKSLKCGDWRCQRCMEQRWGNGRGVGDLIYSRAHHAQ